jgi:hypothetical protein
MPTPIQDEPESTIGRKPETLRHPEPQEQGRTRSGTAMRREEGDESEAGSEIREQERDEPPTVRGPEE